MITFFCYRAQRVCQGDTACCMSARKTTAEPIPFQPSPRVDFTGCQPLKPLTEADVRRIVREELERQQAQGDKHV